MKRYTDGDGGLETACHYPRFRHDCSYRQGHGCIFLGTYGKYDLYACVQEKEIDTVIARFSSDGPDYYSGLPGVRPGNKYWVALNRAEYLGYRSRFELDYYLNI